MAVRVWQSNRFVSWQPNVWDIVALLIVFFLLAMFAYGAMQLTVPYHVGESLPISLDPGYLPYYALRTVIRLLIALVISLLFTFVVGTLAAHNKHAERVIIPMIDILQSIPIMGYLSIAFIVFIWMFPNRMLGPECAAVLAIVTSQVWNICLGFYQSLRMVPYDLREASSMFHLSKWQYFWRVEVPFAMPSLIWNMMMSMSGSWFFLIASEAITVNKQEVLLPGIGSYISMASTEMNTTAIIYAILTMLIVILLYDQLIFRPLIQWSDKFKSETTEAELKPKSLVMMILNRTRVLHRVAELWDWLSDAIVDIGASSNVAYHPSVKKQEGRYQYIWVSLWYVMLFTGCVGITVLLTHFIFKTVSFDEAKHVLLCGVYTSVRILVLIVVCSCIWVPVGVWVGLRPKAAQIVQPIAQFFAAFPANVFFGTVAYLIIKYHLNVEIWTTPLMVLGTQWYILFNVIAGASAFPRDLLHVAQNLSVKRWLWWRKCIFPGIFPYYITGAITAAGGAWNASVVTEFVYWGKTQLVASGLGAYITTVTNHGDFPRVALGIAVMCLYVLVFNRIIWQPLYNLAQKRFLLD
jgi:NitT/TauT family transport system permease protein